MNKITVFIFSFLALLLASPSYGKSKVNDVYFKTSNDKTDLVLDISGIADYKAFLLHSPERLVIDVEDAVWNVGAKNFQNINKLVKNVRHGKPNPKTLRIVLDLNKPVKLGKKSFILPTKNNPKHNLLISFSDPSAPKVKRTKKKIDKNKPASMSSGYKYRSDSPFNIPTFKPLASKGYKKWSKPSRPKSSKSSKKVVKRSSYKPLIVIDAGHGGKDPGAIGRSGIREKIITLRYAKALKHILENTGKYRVYLTRKDDTYIKLHNRVAKARKVKGDLFISLHADSHPNPKTRGLSVYTLSESRAKREADKLERKSTKQEVIRDLDIRKESSDVRRLLIDFAQRDTKNNSAILAETLVNELGGEAKLLRRPHRFAGFAVLTGADIPSVLIELGYLSNSYEDRQLQTKSYRVKLTTNIKDAINRYFKKRPLI